MSRIYFHSPSATTEVRGSERAMFGHGFTRGALFQALNLNDERRPLADYDRKWAESIIRLIQNPGAYLTPDFLALHLGVAGEDLCFDLGDGRVLGVWTTALNTLLATGSDPMVLAARLHGQCEIHAWVEGPNRAWLAGLMEMGRSSGIFRPNAGWEDVIAMLRARNDEPVVTSYSVCDGFPNAWVAKEAGLWSPGPEHQGVYPDDYENEHYRGKPWWDGDEWYDLSVDEQWRLGMEALRGSRGGLEMKPERWRWPDYYFGEPITAFHVAEVAAQASRLTEKPA